MQSIPELVAKSNHARKEGHNSLNVRLDSLDCLISFAIAIRNQDSRAINETMTIALRGGLFDEPIDHSE